MSKFDREVDVEARTKDKTLATGEFISLHGNLFLKSTNGNFPDKIMFNSSEGASKYLETLYFKYLDLKSHGHLPSILDEGHKLVLNLRLNPKKRTFCVVKCPHCGTQVHSDQRLYAEGTEMICIDLECKKSFLLHENIESEVE